MRIVLSACPLVPKAFRGRFHRDPNFSCFLRSNRSEILAPRFPFGRIWRSKAQPALAALYRNSVTNTMSLSYPEPTVFPAKEEHKATVIILHGLGDTAAGWASLANMFSIPGVKFIFPTAPMRPITLNMGMVMTGWYDISSLEEVNQKEDEQGIRESWRYVEGLVAQEEASGIPSSKVVVGGFSQGGAIAMMAARSDKKFAGIVGLSTYVPLRDDAGGIVSEANRTTPILMCHGKSDMVINFEYGSGSANLLSEKGASVSFKEYPYMGHEACIEELEAVKEFLGAAVQ
uniref:Lysophospholipase II n=1 Tax=Tetraselmis sp. GSL018 TaxID=582737 RepID=A0A061QJ69_9CHLO